MEKFIIEFQGIDRLCDLLERKWFPKTLSLPVLVQGPVQAPPAPEPVQAPPAPEPVQAPPAPEPVQAPPAMDGVDLDADLDADGVAWDPAVHSQGRTKTADGRWRARRGSAQAAPPPAPAPEPEPVQAPPAPAPAPEPEPVQAPPAPAPAPTGAKYTYQDIIAAASARGMSIRDLNDASKIMGRESGFVGCGSDADFCDRLYREVFGG